MGCYLNFMKLLYASGLFYSLMLALVYWIGQQSPEFMIVFSNVIFPLTAGVADLFLGYAELEGFYYEENPFELFWLWGYVAFIVGFQIHKMEF